MFEIKNYVLCFIKGDDLLTSPAVVDVLTAESAVLVKLLTVTVIDEPKFV